MLQKRGFGEGSFKNNEDIRAVQNYLQKGKISEAEGILLALKDRKKLDHIGLHLLATIYKFKSDHLSALKLLNQSIKLEPLYAEAYADIGAIYIEINNLSQAIGYLEKSLEIKPEGLGPNINLGLVYRKIGKYKIALKYFSQAIKINPNNSNLNFNIGQIYEQYKDFNKTIFFYKKSILNNPNNGNALIALFSIYLKVFDWHSINDIGAKLSEFGTKYFEGGEPMTFLYYDDDPLKQKLRAQLFFNNYFKRNAVDIKLKKNKKIKIGYLSNNFVVHPVSFLISKVIETHNRFEFDIHGYSINPLEDEVTKKLAKSFDSFKNISNESDDLANKKIREDNLDILIDLMGYTKGSRMAILSKRAAPIQISYLAYPSTTGSDQIDYIIADKNIIPKNKKSFYTEKVVYLPKTFICFDDSTKISATYQPNQFANRNENSFIFVGFHKVEKLNISTLNSWIKIMNKIENSYLWLKQTNTIASKNLLNFFESKNIDPSRIVFAEKLELYEEHLARYRFGDLLLDTFIYNGHTTTIESLWAGLPVITLEGNSFASRVSSSILRSIGFDALIAKTKDEYIEKVVFYAENKNELNRFKTRLLNLKREHELFNTKEFVKNFEKVLKKIKNDYKK